MAAIAISDLKPQGAALFDGSESYMHDLCEDELTVQGALSPSFYIASVIVVSISVGWWAN